MPVTITSLELENVKRIKAILMEPNAAGLTMIGGRNGQGKTSVLDAICWALGGEKYRPSAAQREGSMIPPNLKVTLSNGYIVERKGKNSALKVTDPGGGASGQQMLNTFIEQLALDLPRFLQSSAKEKADTLLRIIGVGDQLAALEQQGRETYNQRLVIGREADRKKKFAEEQPYFPDAPDDLVSVSELIREQQDILACNGENQRKRNRAEQLQRQSADLERQLQALQAQYDDVRRDYDIACTAAADLQDQSTAELEASITNAEEINRQVRANLDKQKAQDDAAGYSAQYEALSSALEDIRERKTALLVGANLPLPGLSVEEGELLYNGFKWDNMSGSEQLRVATAIVRRLNPDCGFVLMDRLEQMDMDTLREFGAWLEGEGLQVIATRVSTGGECSIIIEDGMATEPAAPAEAAQHSWKDGWNT